MPAVIRAKNHRPIYNVQLIVLTAIWWIRYVHFGTVEWGIVVYFFVLLAKEQLNNYYVHQLKSQEYKYFDPLNQTILHLATLVLIAWPLPQRLQVFLFAFIAVLIFLTIGFVYILIQYLISGKRYKHKWTFAIISTHFVFFLVYQLNDSKFIFTERGIFVLFHGIFYSLYDLYAKEVIPVDNGDVAISEREVLARFVFISYMVFITIMIAITIFPVE